MCIPRSFTAVHASQSQLYNLINKRLPGWQDPPRRNEIMEALRAYDEDGNGTLDEKEFEAFARSLMKTGPDAFFSRVGKSAVVHTAFLPAAAVAVQKLTPNSAVRATSCNPPLYTRLIHTQVGNTPLHFLAPIIGTVAGALRGLVPF